MTTKAQLMYQSLNIHGSEIPKRVGNPTRDNVLAAYNELKDLLEYANGVIANVSGGDWSQQNTGWQEAAKEFTKQYADSL